MAQSQHTTYPSAGRLPYDSTTHRASVGPPAQAGGAGSALARSYLVEVPRVLAAWRAAERRLSDPIATSQDWTQILADIAALRARYHELFRERMARRDPPLTVGGDEGALPWVSPGSLRRN